MKDVTAALDIARAHWPALEPLFLIRNEREYDAAVARLNELLDEIGTDEDHPLFNLLDTLGTLISAYEQEHERLPPVSGGDMLRYLMEEHELCQGDLPEIGSQGVVSEILNGKRELNVRQIQALAALFGVSPAVFL